MLRDVKTDFTYTIISDRRQISMTPTLIIQNLDRENADLELTNIAGSEPSYTSNLVPVGSVHHG